MKNFWKNTSGGMAINFAVASTALLIAVGAATDVSLLSSEKSKLQDWADSTALAAAVSAKTAEIDFQEFSEKFLDSSPFPDATVETSWTNGNLTVGLTETKELAFMGAFGHDTKELYAEAEVPLSVAPLQEREGSTGNNYNIALVLDTTSSMRSSRRIDDLKTAATNFLTGLENQASADTQVSLVPFSNYVRIPVSYENESWIEVPTQSTEPPHRYSHAGWEGCMNSRRDDLHKTPDFDGRRLQGFWEGARCGEEYTNELVPLTNDWANLKDNLNGWIVDNPTFIPSGLIWGWRTLSPNAPFTEAAANPNAENVMIVMTDGSNTINIGGELEHSNGIYHIGSDVPYVERQNY